MASPTNAPQQPAQVARAKTKSGSSPEKLALDSPSLSNPYGPVQAALRSPGSALGAPSRTFFESRFGHDFGSVRVHTGAEAVRATHAIGANAFTVGSDIVFAPGRYSPDQPAGQRLLAHELTHVVQQSGQRVQAKLSAGEPNDKFEREAENVASGVMQDTKMAPVSRKLPPYESGGSLQRDCESCERDASGGVAPGVGEDIGFTHAGGTSAALQTLRTREARLQGDLAIEPPNPDVATPELTDAEVAAAIRFNERRFQDPYTVAIIRDYIGIPRFPAVSDRDLALGIAYWQAQFNLTVDGQIGPATSRTILRAIDAAGGTADARNVRIDNSIAVSPVGALTRTVPSATTTGVFRRDVQFRTSLRNGWLIQVLNNTWNEVHCTGGPLGTAPTLNYSEAWWVNGAGQVELPTSVTTPPTTTALAGVHDIWRRPARRNTRGAFAMNARLFTTLRLPAGFGFGVVPDALALPARVGAPNSDALGLVAARRRESGRWNGCAGVVNFHTA